MKIPSFNSRPHEEVDLSILGCFLTSPSFNSRPHEEVDIFPSRKCRLTDTFQFTTSRGGRRRWNAILCSFKSFNSRPHEEVDPPYIQIIVSISSFQFTTSRGGRPGSVRYVHSFCHLSIHDLTRRSTLKVHG